MSKNFFGLVKGQALPYAIGLLLMSAASLEARTSREIGNQSKSGVKALVDQAMAKASQIEVERIKREQADAAAANRASSPARPEEPQNDAIPAPSDVIPAEAGTQSSSGISRLESTPPQPTTPTEAQPAVVITEALPAGAAAYQAAIVTALNNVATNGAAITDVGNAGLGADLVKATAGVVAVPVSTVPTVVLHDAIVTVLAATNTAAAMQGALTVAALKALPVVGAAGISDAVLSVIVADVNSVVAVGAGVGTATFPAAGIHLNTVVAAAAFGIAFEGGQWVIKRPLNLTPINGTANVLHFHQGDYSQTAGFFLGLDDKGDYRNLTAANAAYALSHVDLTPDDRGRITPIVSPIAPEKVTLNTVAKSANPIHGKGLTQLLMGANDQPFVAVANDPTHLYQVTNIFDGSTVIMNKDAAAATDFPINTVDPVTPSAHIFDIAATLKPTQYAATGALTENLVFAAVADNANLKVADAAKTGIAVAVVGADHLKPLDATNTTLAPGAANKAAHIDLAAGQLLSVANAATFVGPDKNGVNQGDINLWWDDRYQQLFGTVAGIQPGATAADAAFGLFHGKNVADTFVLQPMQDLNADRLNTKDALSVAASVFGATGQTGKVATNAVINLSRPRTMHTSTDKNYLLVTGGVATDKALASKAWVNALPLMPPAGGADDGKLAQADFTKALAAFDVKNPALTPCVDRTNASSDVVDAYTPYIVGRFPSYLAPVSSDQVGVAYNIVGTKTFIGGSELAAGSKIVSAALHLASLRGDIAIEDTGAGGGTFTLANGTEVFPGVILGSDVTFKKDFQLGVGTVLEKSQFVADATLTTGDLDVTQGKLTVAANSELAAASQIKNTTLVNNVATLGDAGANTVFNTAGTDIIGAASKLAKGSVINQPADVTVAVGGGVNFKVDQVNEFNKDSITDVQLKALGANPTVLHKVEDNPVNTAVALLKAEADAFAGNPGFGINNIAGEFQGIAFDAAVLGAVAGDVDSKNALQASVATAVAGVADGKTALANLSTAMAADYAGHPTLARGFGVADAIVQKATNAGTTQEVFVEGLNAARDLSGVSDKTTAVPVLNYGTRLFNNTNPAHIILDGATQMTIANLHTSADTQELLKAGALAVRQDKIRSEVLAAMNAADAAIIGAKSADEKAAFAAAGAVAGADDATKGLHLFNAALTAALTEPGVVAKQTSEGKFVVSATNSVVAKIPDTFPGQRTMLADAIAAAYQGAAAPFQATWGTLAVTAEFKNDAGVGLGVFNQDQAKADRFLDAFKNALPGGAGAYTAAPNAAGDIDKLSRIYDAGAANNADCAQALRAMVAKSLGAGYYPVENTMLVLNTAIANFTQAPGGDSIKKMAAQAVHQYNILGGAPAARTDKAYLDKYASKDIPLQQLAGTLQDFFQPYADPAGVYKDSGFAVLDAASKAIYNAANQPAVDALNVTLPATAFDTLSKHADAAAPVAGAEIFANRAAVQYSPAADLVIPANNPIGAGSVLRNVTVSGNDVWQFGAGVTLEQGTTLPAWTLFKKGLGTSYNANIAAAPAAAAPAANTPWGGQWVLGSIADFTAAERAKLGVVGADLNLKNIDDAIKIAANRKITSDTANANASLQYSLLIPDQTILPAGTKIHNNDAVNAYATDLRGRFAGAPAELDFSVNNIAVGGFHELADSIVLNGDFERLNELTLEYPVYPTKLPVTMVLPAGTMIKATGAIDAVVTTDVVQNILAATQFAKSDGTAALTGLVANDVYILPVAGKVINNALPLAAKNISITGDPLFTPGIIRGSFSPTNAVTQPYKPNVPLTLGKNSVQDFAPGTSLPVGTELGATQLDAGATGFYVPFGMYAFSGPDFIAQETALADGTTFTDLGISVLKAPLVLGGGWDLDRNILLPEDSTITLKAGFNQDYSNVIKTLAGAAVAAFNKAGGAVVADFDVTVPADGYKVVAHLATDDGVNKQIQITVPAGKTIQGGTLARSAGAVPGLLTANLDIQEANDGPVTTGVLITAGSVVAAGSKLEPGFKVQDLPAYPGGVLEALKTDGTVAGGLEIQNANGNVIVQSHDGPLNIAAVPGNYDSITAGVAPLVLKANLAVAGGKTIEVAPKSTLGVGTVFTDVTLNAPLTVSGAEDILQASVVGAGSVMKNGTVVAVNNKVTVAGANPLTLNADDALKLGTCTVAGDTKATADCQFTIGGAGGAGVNVPAVVTWNINDGGSVTLDANTKLKVLAAGQATLGDGSIVGKNSQVTTPDSPYATSATDMTVIGDSVFIALEGDKNDANGIESGVFKSTALFDDTGKVRGWTPWQRVGANIDATAFYGFSEDRGDLVYLTSSDGQSFLDVATNSLINPATTVKLTQWSDGDDANHGGSSLARVLASKFATDDNPRPGVYGLFDFDADTRSFKTVNRRFEDPNFSCMVATGFERVALIQTGKLDGKTFTPTPKFELDTNVFTFDANKGLAGLGLITAAEVTRNAAAGVQNWFFVGGEKGLAVLINPVNGEGFPAGLNATGANTLGALKDHRFVELKVAPATSITNVRKIVADEATGYVYVVTKDSVLRINPSVAAFQARPGALTHGVLPANDIVTLADVANSKYAAGAAGELLTHKAINGVDNAEFTDLVIMKSTEAGAHDTTLLLATSAGLVVSDAAVINDAFAGDAAALQTNDLWKPFKYTVAGPNDTEINARDFVGGNPAKLAAGVGAVLRMQPLNLQSGGRMVIDAKGVNVPHTFEGNLNVLATDADGKELRTYRLDVTGGAVKVIKEATNKAAGVVQPYFAKIGTMDPALVQDLDFAFYQRVLADDQFYPALPTLPSQQVVEDAITAAAAADAELNFGFGLSENLYIPTPTVNSASGSTYMPAESGVKVNE